MLSVKLCSRLPSEFVFISWKQWWSSRLLGVGKAAICYELFASLANWIMDHEWRKRRTCHIISIGNVTQYSFSFQLTKVSLKNKLCCWLSSEKLVFKCIFILLNMNQWQKVSFCCLWSVSFLKIDYFLGGFYFSSSNTNTLDPLQTMAKSFEVTELPGIW